MINKNLKLLVFLLIISREEKLLITKLGLEIGLIIKVEMLRYSIF